MNKTFAALLISIFFAPLPAQTGSRNKTNQVLPAGYWRLEKSQPIIDKTQTIRLAPDLSHLSEGERKAVAKLLEVGKIFQSIYEGQGHKQALSAFHNLKTVERSLNAAPPTGIINLLMLYRLFQGPIATTLENKREPFLPVESVVPGKNMYPWGVKKEEIEAYAAAHPDRREEIMGSRTAVRATSLDN